MSDRDPRPARVAGAPLTEAEKQEVARTEAKWREIEKTPEYRDMRFSLEQQIAATRTGEVGRLSVDANRGTFGEEYRERLITTGRALERASMARPQETKREVEDSRPIHAARRAHR